MSCKMNVRKSYSALHLSTYLQFSDLRKQLSNDHFDLLY